MNTHGEDDQADVFLNEGDILEEILVDEEDLPDADDGIGSDVDLDEPDDSMHIFTGHTGHKDSVSSFAFSADGQLLVSRGFDRVI